MSAKNLHLRPLWLPLLLALAAVLCAGWAWLSARSTSVDVDWQTASEVNTAGFLLYRSESQEGPGEKITANLIPVQGDALTGGSYHYTDATVRAGRTYYYWLEEVETGGGANRHGPITVEAGGGGVIEALSALVLAVLSIIAFWQALRRRPASEKA
jgi:hypothetical protein